MADCRTLNQWRLICVRMLPFEGMPYTNLSLALYIEPRVSDILQYLTHGFSDCNKQCERQTHDIKTRHTVSSYEEEIVGARYLVDIAD